MSLALYRKHRPRKLEEVVGQDSVIRSLTKLIQKDSVPHALLLSGPSGCGKTTVARILKRVLRCGKQDFIEINCADFRGIDLIRDMRRLVGLTPAYGDSRIWLIDEAHQLTKDAQDAILKMLEDIPDHAYFMLATTEGTKLRPTIHTRCTELKFSVLPTPALRGLVVSVMTKEGLRVEDSVVDELVDAAEGSARKALVLLEQVGWLETTEEQMQAIYTTAANKDEAINLARELITNPRPDWRKCAGILKTLENGDVERVRYLMLGYARTVLLGGGKFADRAFMVIEIFGRNFYDSKQAGLAAACWEVVHPAK